MDQHYDSDDDDGAGDDVPGREAYDFTNAELARNLDDSIPISYVIFKLIKAAPGFWKNSRTANCVLKIPLSPPGVSAVTLHAGANLSTTMLSAGGRASVNPTAPLSGSQRVVTQPNPSSPMVMTLALHLDYLLPQSMLFRAVFPGSPHLHLITRIFADEKEHAFDFSPPWSPFTWPAWRTPRIVPNTGGLPTAIVPVPHPPSLYAVLHYLYFGNLAALGEYIRTGTMPQSSPASSSQQESSPQPSSSTSGAGLAGGTMPPSRVTPTPGSHSATTREGLPLRRPPPLPFNNESNTSNPLATRSLPPTPAPPTSSSPFSLDLEGFTIRWQGVVNNAEYLGLPVHLRTWLSLFWKEECPDVEMPVFHEEVYFPPSLPTSPSRARSPSLHDSSELDDGSGSGESESDGDDGHRDTGSKGVGGQSPFKSPRAGTSRPVPHSPIAKSSSSPRKHEWRASSYK